MLESISSKNPGLLACFEEPPSGLTMGNMEHMLVKLSPFSPQHPLRVLDRKGKPCIAHCKPPL